MDGHLPLAWDIRRPRPQQCSGIAVPTVFGVLSDVSCQDRGRVCWAWSGLVGMKAELGHSLTSTQALRETVSVVGKCNSSHVPIPLMSSFHLLYKSASFTRIDSVFFSQVKVSTL